MSKHHAGTGWANSCPGWMDRLGKRYSHLVGGSFLAGKAAWALSGCLTTDSADYCMLVNEWARLMSRVCLLRLEVDLGSVLEPELRQNEDMGMYRLKLVAREKIKGLVQCLQDAYLEV